MKEPVLIDHDAFEFIVEALRSALPFVDDDDTKARTKNAIHLGQFFLDSAPLTGRL